MTISESTQLRDRIPSMIFQEHGWTIIKALIPWSHLQRKKGILLKMAMLTIATFVKHMGIYFAVTFVPVLFILFASRADTNQRRKSDGSVSSARKKIMDWKVMLLMGRNP
jgi:hypothetical protein